MMLLTDECSLYTDLTTRDRNVFRSSRRWNRSSGGRFVGTVRRTARAVHAALRTILTNSLYGHHQRNALGKETLGDNICAKTFTSFR